MTSDVPRLLIVEDDPPFRALLVAGAKREGFQPFAFESLVELGSFARIKEFDLALLDFYLESLTGREIAQYVDAFFAHIPVVIISGHAESEIGIEWPASVRAFVPKQHGIDAIMQTAKRVLATPTRRPKGESPLNKGPEESSRP